MHMRIRFAAIALFAVSFGSGCDFIEATNTASNGGNVVADAIERAEPAISGLEDATGRTIPADVSEAGEASSNRVERIADAAGKAAAIVATIPGPQQPILGTIATAIGAIGALAGAVGGFFARRKQRALRSVLVAVDEEEGIGAKILAKTAADGVADIVRSEYQKAIK